MPPKKLGDGKKANSEGKKAPLGQTHMTLVAKMERVVRSKDMWTWESIKQKQWRKATCDYCP